jgi:hypothetical protein
LARVTEALAAGPVNIRAIASEFGNARPFFRIVTSDVATTERALKNAGLEFNLCDVINIELLDRPGELAKIAKRLARAGVNVESVYILATKDGKTEIAFNVNDAKKAMEILKVT